MSNIKGNIEYSISGLERAIKNCRLYVATPLMLGIARNLQRALDNKNITKEEFQEYNKQLNKIASQSSVCLCAHPLEIYA